MTAKRERYWQLIWNKIVRHTGVPLCMNGLFRRTKLIEDLKKTRAESRQLSRDLQESKAWLEEAQRVAHLGHYCWNLLTDRVIWSDELYRIYGLPPQEGPIDMAMIREMIHPEDREFVFRGAEEALHSDVRAQGEHRIVRPDGEVRTVYGLGTIKRDASGRPYEMFGTIQDITGRKRAEEALQRSLESAIRTGTDYDVEFRVCLTDDGPIRFLRGVGHHNPSAESGEYVGITMDITERKRAEQERERLHRLEADLACIQRVNMMGELAASLAHEIKQPIAAALTNAKVCLRWLGRDAPDLAEGCAAASRMVSDVTRAAEIIERVRSLYRRDTQKRDTVDPNQIIREIVALLRDAANQHGVRVQTELDAELPAVVADRVQLQQVLMNLMLNAIEAMKDSGGELTIKSERDGDGQLLISVSDNGPGVPADKFEKIFNAFVTTKPQGTGMGLTISRSIVELHGGRLWVKANSALGATFQFTLPSDPKASSIPPTSGANHRRQ
jgi:PAS domain S-box-containing protein